MNNQEGIIKEIQTFHQNDFTGEMFDKGGEAELLLGSFALPSTYKNVVVKCWKSDAINRVNKSEVNCLWKYSHHPNIIRFFGVFMEDQIMTGVVIEYLEDGNVYKAIHPTNKHIRKEFSSRRKLDWIVQASYALQYLHSCKIAHRDVTLKNMLLTANYKVLKICDFGLMKNYNLQNTTTIRGEGTPFYLPPEKIGIIERTPEEGDKYKADIYSFSICIYEILSGKVPYTLTEGMSLFTLQTKIFKKNLRPSFKNTNIKDEIREFLTIDWSHIPEKRHETKVVVKFYEKQLAEEGEDILCEIDHSSSNPISFNRSNIYSKIAECLLSNKNCHSLCQKVTKYFEEVSRIIENGVYLAEDEERILKLQKELKESLGKVEECRGLDDQWPAGVEMPDWKQITTHIQEIEEISKEKLSKLGEINAFILACNQLEEEAKQAKILLENGNYGHLKSFFEAIVQKKNNLDEIQAENEKFYKKYTNLGLRDRLDTSKQIIREIEDWFLGLYKMTGRSISVQAKEIKQYLDWCQKMSDKIQELDEENLSQLCKDVEKHRDDFSQKFDQFNSSQMILAALEVQLDASEALQVQHFQEKLNSLSQALREATEYLNGLKRLEQELPDCSLLDKTNPNISLQERQENLKTFGAELSNISVQFELMNYGGYFHRQLKRLMDREYKQVKAKHEDICKINRRMIELLEVTTCYIMK